MWGFFRWPLAAAVAVTICLSLVGWSNGRVDPVVRTATLALADWPDGAPAIRVALLSDIHLGNTSTGRDRLRRVVDATRALRPDLVLLAGDYLAGYDPASARRAAPIVATQFARIHPPLGIVAVLGNHDNLSDPNAVRTALTGSGIAVVENGAVRRGPLVIGGVGDTGSGHAKLGGTLNAMRRLRAVAPGAEIYLSHSPDIVRWLPRRSTMLLAGHTHCGQIVLPVIGTLIHVSRVHRNRYRCGIVRDPNIVTVITAGIGTSDVPLRFGAPPDLWLLTLGPARRERRVEHR